MGDLTLNFDRDEFECQCGCGFDRVDRIFIFKLQLVREQAGFGFTINSGCRCPEHNKNEGGSETSWHLVGKAADIKVKTDQQRYRLVSAAIDAGFPRIRPAKHFVHLAYTQDGSEPKLGVY